MSIRWYKGGKFFPEENITPVQGSSDELVLIKWVSEFDIEYYIAQYFIDEKSINLYNNYIFKILGNGKISDSVQRLTREEFQDFIEKDCSVVVFKNGGINSDHVHYSELGFELNY